MKTPQLAFRYLFLSSTPAFTAETMRPLPLSLDQEDALIILAILTITILAVIVRYVDLIVAKWHRTLQVHRSSRGASWIRSVIDKLDQKQIQRLIALHHKRGSGANHIMGLCILLALCLLPDTNHAQVINNKSSSPLWQQGGIIITVVLVALPIILGLILMVIKIRKLVGRQAHHTSRDEIRKLAHYLENMTSEERERLIQRQHVPHDDSPTDTAAPVAPRAAHASSAVLVKELSHLPVVPLKKKALPRPTIDPRLSRLIQWYLISATFWLVIGTTVGEYLGIKFVAPDIDSLSWLSFGRLRPVHTNAVFWGWSSLGMLGLGYYIVPRVSRVGLAHLSWGWYSLYLINAAVLLGSISLMAGINNGGGEYREYIWPIMLLFALGIAFSLGSYYQTVARRKTEEIYISNWYIICAVIFIAITAIVGYIPAWQNGLGETIVQGYYMHQAVGMWFMLFSLGIVYYFLPQQLNRPVYSYSLGILAFWSQILFYTLIGTHHFVFSAIAWWIQTVAIVASVGMVIPVVAGTTNFMLTFRGAWHRVKDSYILPFFLVGIIFYFTGSLQGTAQAFRYTNLLWHFTDFTVAHSHMTMYGIIAFLLWGGIYALLPRLSGQEAPHFTVGAHFWLALIGLLVYSISLMYGGTLRGLAWMNNVPFIETVSLMMPYWLWRAIGGTLMWISHLFFAYNVYRMIRVPTKPVDITNEALRQLEEKWNINN